MGRSGVSITTDEPKCLGRAGLLLPVQVRTGQDTRGDEKRREERRGEERRGN